MTYYSLSFFPIIVAYAIRIFLVKFFSTNLQEENDILNLQTQWDTTWIIESQYIDAIIKTHATAVGIYPEHKKEENSC